MEKVNGGHFFGICVRFLGCICIYIYWNLEHIYIYTYIAKGRSTPYIWDKLIPPWMMGILINGYINPYGIGLMSIPLGSLDSELASYPCEVMPLPLVEGGHNNAKGNATAYPRRKILLGDYYRMMVHNYPLIRPCFFGRGWDWGGADP